MYVIIGKPKNQPTAQVQALSSEMNLNQVLAFWKNQGMYDWKPKPLVAMADNPDITLDTSRGPWAAPGLAQRGQDLSAEERKTFAALVSGHHQNFVLLPGVFADSPAAFICVAMPLDEEVAQITPETKMRYMPIYVQLTADTGHLVQHIGGAQLHPNTKDEKVPVKKPAMPANRQTGAAAPSKSSVPVATGTVIDIASRLGKRHQ